MAVFSSLKSWCASVITRLQWAGIADWLGGSPELWRVVLDLMAGDLRGEAACDYLSERLPHFQQRPTVYEIVRFVDLKS